MIQMFSLNLFAKVDISSRDELGLDESLRTQEQEYTLNENILITPLFLPSGRDLQPEEWIRGLYYYSVERLGFPDVPFHYIITYNGKIYKGNEVGDEAKIDIVDADSNSIIIAYLAKEEDVNFSDQGKVALDGLLIELANKNAIESDSINIANLRFKLNLATKLSSLEARDIVGGWEETLKDSRAQVKANYSPLQRKYHIEVVEVKAPSVKVKPGETVIIELSLKNSGESSIYSGTNAELLASKKDDKLSKFFMNNVWASQSQVAIMSEGDMMKPNETKVFQLKFRVPLYFGKQTENFNIENGLGEKVDGTDFTVTMEVDQISETVVEILETETGYLNIRKADSGNSDVLQRVSPGERYIQKKTGEYGYVQIDLGEGVLGWASQKYVKKVN